MGAVSTTSWLEYKLNWTGVMVLTDPKSSFHAQKSKRNPKTRVLHACLSTDTDTKEVSTNYCRICKGLRCVLNNSLSTELS